MGTLVKNKIIYGGSQQYYEISDPSEDLLGTIVQFVGASNANYTNGYFYKCVEAVPATDPKTYMWERCDVQPNGSIDTYTKAETNALLDAKASLDISEISTAGGGKEVHATISQGEDEASINYYKTTELPDTLNLNIGSDSFRVPMAGYVDKKVGAVPFVATYDQTSYADVVAAIDANKPIVIDFANNHNLFCVTYSTYGAAGSDVIMYAIYKMANDITLATIILTSADAWSITHTNLQDKLVSGTNIKTVNNQSLLGAGNIEVDTYTESILITIRYESVYPGSAPNTSVEELRRKVDEACYKGQTWIAVYTETAGGEIYPYGIPSTSHLVIRIEDVSEHKIRFYYYDSNFQIIQVEMTDVLNGSDEVIDTTYVSTAIDLQEKLIAGDNITIDGNTISATGGGGGNADFTLDTTNDFATIQNQGQGMSFDFSDANGITVIASDPGTYQNTKILATQDYVDSVVSGNFLTTAEVHTICQGILV